MLDGPTGLRWLAIWSGGGGEERKKSSATKDAAKAHLTCIEHHQRSGTYISQDRGRVFVRDLIDAWVATQIHLKPSTMAATRSDVRYDPGPADRRHDLRQIPEVPELVRRGGPDRRLTHQRSEPAQGAEAEHMFLTVAQGGRLAREIDGQFEDLVWFLATTGPRFWEAAELRTKDIDIQRGRVRVARSFTEVDGQMVIGPPKNGRERTVPLTAIMVDRLGARLQGRGRDALVFPSLRGHYLRSNNFKTRAHDPAVEAAGLFDQELSDVAVRMDALLKPEPP